MTKCGDCFQEMNDLKTKTCDHTYIFIDEKEYKRDTTYFDKNKRCHDCGVVNKKGNLHHIGCDMERCPKCKKQLLSCDCKKGFTFKF